MKDKRDKKDKFFIDTNIIVYIFDKNNKDKQEKAQNILRQAIDSLNGIISFQVVQEFCSVALSKFEVPLSTSDCRIFINKFLYPLCYIFPTLELYNKAIDIKETTNYGFYDCLIIASALEGDCTVLYSENFKNHEEIGKMKIVNPFSV